MAQMVVSLPQPTSKCRSRLRAPPPPAEIEVVEQETEKIIPLHGGSNPGCNAARSVSALYKIRAIYPEKVMEKDGQERLLDIQNTRAENISTTVLESTQRIDSNSGGRQNTTLPSPSTGTTFWKAFAGSRDRLSRMNLYRSRYRYPPRRCHRRVLKSVVKSLCKSFTAKIIRPSAAEAGDAINGVLGASAPSQDSWHMLQALN